MYAIRSYYVLVGLDADKLFLEARDEGARAQHQRVVLGRATVEQFAVDAAFEVEGHLVITSYSIHYTKLYEVFPVRSNISCPQLMRVPDCRDDGSPWPERRGGDPAFNDHQIH